MLIPLGPRTSGSRSSLGSRSILPESSVSIAAGQPALLASYQPSQQNTSDGKLTEKMLLDVFRRAQKLVGLHSE
jgi:uracil-DNA glycosylase